MLSCGLDFGTSNSTIGVPGPDGAPRLVALENDEVTLPSVIFFNFETDTVHYGRDALGQYVAGVEGRLMRSLKSLLGTALFADRTRIKAETLDFSQIIGQFVGAVKRRAEAALDAEIGPVVVGRPVRFVDEDDVADRTAEQQLEGAIRAQGFSQVAFQYEPIAAAMDYERQVTRERLALVVDLGGGTSDFSVLRLSPGRASAADRTQDILGTAGVHIGGTDFDRQLSMEEIMPGLGLGTMTRDGKRRLPVAPYYDLSTWHRINRLYDAKALRDLRSTVREAAEPEKAALMAQLVEARLGHALLARVEAAKIALSEDGQTAFDFDIDGDRLEKSLVMAQLTEAASGLVAGIERTIDTVLTYAGVRPGRVDCLVLTGGTTLLPAITELLVRRFPDAEIARPDVLGSVGLGLAVEAGRMFGRPEAALRRRA